MPPSKIAPLVHLLAASASVAFVASCTGGSNGAPPEKDGGPSRNGLPVAQCPGASPKDGDACSSVPEGTTCMFGACGAPIFRCSGGVWQQAANELPRLPCPTETPESDSECHPCWPTGVTCSYGSTDCSAADASLNTATASCVSGRWSVEFHRCRDGGADVQGDGSRRGD